MHTCVLFIQTWSMNRIVLIEELTRELMSVLLVLLQHMPVGCYVLQYVAVCCSVLQCVAMCCSMSNESIHCSRIYSFFAVVAVCISSVGCCSYFFTLDTQMSHICPPGSLIEHPKRRNTYILTKESYESAKSPYIEHPQSCNTKKSPTYSLNSIIHPQTRPIYNTQRDSQKIFCARALCLKSTFLKAFMPVFTNRAVFLDERVEAVRGPCVCGKRCFRRYET